MATTPSGLIAHSLEIGKVLAEHDRAVLHAKGMCMYPLVRPGDRLHIQSRSVQEVNVGEIAVCRREGRLVCHRIAGKGVLDGRTYIVTRSDRNRKTDEDFIYDTDLLGIVTSIERNGRTVNPREKRHDGPFRFCLEARRTLYDLYCYLKKHVAGTLPSLQGTAAYRAVSRWLSPALRRPPRYEVQVWKESWRKLGFHLPLKPEEFNISDPMFRDRVTDCWSLVLRIDGSQEPSAQATFREFSGKWNIDNLRVRRRYRGMGLEKGLIERAEEIFNRNGILNHKLEIPGLE